MLSNMVGTSSSLKMTKKGLGLDVRGLWVESIMCQVTQAEIFAT